ncbi:aromatic ring-hydroxylating dioxygenase subunit alpha [Altericroceibacterium spongiae]|uniref:Aromatic ring-hydroxylating dioxygenase subunit alpha n=1 Tax=Altericroceibacterium spongiae TaxID=2320269 RepID=A0A420EM43_9SPHN|nr:aromatic ring-hydroxylating dioxygenase subunit alpha [Altericroceibacterium spongiae]RKF21759.1 aromatic ring-hydroxylating dioxygenase subunit alpha [Altericroceibacterium spongiae]
MQEATSSPKIGAKSMGVADRSTPLLRNYWYVAAFSDEISRQPMRRTILEEDIVFYRTEDGKPVAVQNRCPHRSFPLHTGRVEGDRIVCGYHGMEFNPDGSCALVPALNTAPKAIRLDAYPLEEDGPLLWIWMGDPANPDYSRLIRQEWCTSPEWTHVKGYMYMKANYLGLHENLMDLTHFPFLHGKWNIARPEHAAAPSKIEEGEGFIRQREVHHDVGMPPALVEAVGMKAPFDREAQHMVQIPGMHQGRQITTDASDPPKADEQHIIHIMTPETQTSTHYMWAMARNNAVDDEELSEQIRVVGEGAFMEDKVALEDIEELVARDHRPNFREKIIKTDEGGIRVLRMFARLAAQEQEGMQEAIAAE